MTQQTEQRNGYNEHRAARKADRVARKAAKPKGIDFPLRKAMPMPLLLVFGVLAVVTLVLVVAVMINPPTPRIALAERRSPPSTTASHDVGNIILAPIPDPLPTTTPPCDALEGVVIEGGDPAQIRIGGVLERMCPHANLSSPVGRSIRALAGVRIRFARFARTGDTSTLAVADPPRVLINVQFSRRDLSAMWIAPLLAHEGFHVLHKDEPWTATLEYEAREVEREACKLLVDVRGWPRGCTDAERLLHFGRTRAIDQLVRAGFPR